MRDYSYIIVRLTASVQGISTLNISSYLTNEKTIAIATIITKTIKGWGLFSKSGSTYRDD